MKQAEEDNETGPCGAGIRRGSAARHGILATGRPQTI